VSDGAGSLLSGSRCQVGSLLSGATALESAVDDCSVVCMGGVVVSANAPPLMPAWGAVCSNSLPPGAHCGSMVLTAAGSGPSD